MDSIRSVVVVVFFVENVLPFGGAKVIEQDTGTFRWGVQGVGGATSQETAMSCWQDRFV